MRKRILKKIYLQKELNKDYNNKLKDLKHDKKQKN